MHTAKVRLKSNVIRLFYSNPNAMLSALHCQDDDVTFHDHSIHEVIAVSSQSSQCVR